MCRCGAAIAKYKRLVVNDSGAGVGAVQHIGLKDLFRLADISNGHDTDGQPERRDMGLAMVADMRVDCV